MRALVESVTSRVARCVEEQRMDARETDNIIPSWLGSFLPAIPENIPDLAVDDTALYKAHRGYKRAVLKQENLYMPNFYGVELDEVRLGIESGVINYSRVSDRVTELSNSDRPPDMKWDEWLDILRQWAELAQGRVNMGREGGDLAEYFLAREQADEIKNKVMINLGKIINPVDKLMLLSRMNINVSDHSILNGVVNEVVKYLPQNEELHRFYPRKKNSPQSRLRKMLRDGSVFDIDRTVSAISRLKDKGMGDKIEPIVIKLCNYVRDNGTLVITADSRVMAALLKFSTLEGVGDDIGEIMLKKSLQLARVGEDSEFFYRTIISTLVKMGRKEDAMSLVPYISQFELRSMAYRTILMGAKNIEEALAVIDRIHGMDRLAHVTFRDGELQINGNYQSDTNVKHEVTTIVNSVVWGNDPRLLQELSDRIPEVKTFIKGIEDFGLILDYLVEMAMNNPDDAWLARLTSDSVIKWYRHLRESSEVTPSEICECLGTIMRLNVQNKKDSVLGRVWGSKIRANAERA